MPHGVDGVAEAGTLSLHSLHGSPGYPSRERLLKGPCAVIECIEEIPCNPCESACPQGAIHIGKPITNVPHLDPDKCIGCGLCISACPGLAIFLVDMTQSESGKASVSFPYEYLPLPRRGDVVRAVDRQGRVRCEATVKRILNPARNDRTPVITVEVPFELAEEIRGITLADEVDDSAGR